MNINNFTKEQIASYIDHTCLKADASESDILKLCREARQYNFASVCVNPSWTALVAKQLQGCDVKTCTVISFPLGSDTPEMKAAQAFAVVQYGTDEIDMVINVGAIKSENWKLVRDDIRSVVGKKGNAILKVIIEACLLTEFEKMQVCTIAKEEGADFVKTSTGFSSGGATIEDIALMRETVGPDMGVKASGGIRTLEDVVSLITAGASRIGASAGKDIICSMK